MLCQNEIINLPLKKSESEIETVGGDFMKEIKSDCEKRPSRDIMIKGKAIEDITGKRFGKLKIISVKLGEHRSVKWNCLCDCGKEVVKCASPLKRKHVKSCGCLYNARRIQVKGHRPFEWLYKTIISKSIKRNIEVALTFDDFLEFTKIKQCHYCGCPIEWADRTHCVTGRYNLDRKDNNTGYTKDNCVVCCKECNYAKRNLFTYDEMLIIGKAIGEVKAKRCVVSSVGVPIKET